MYTDCRAPCCRLLVPPPHERRDLLLGLEKGRRRAAEQGPTYRRSKAQNFAIGHDFVIGRDIKSLALLTSHRTILGQKDAAMSKSQIASGDPTLRWWTRVVLILTAISPVLGACCTEQLGWTWLLHYFIAVASAKGLCVNPHIRLESGWGGVAGNVHVSFAACSFS